MAVYGNTHVGGRSIFSTRKVRSNKGISRGSKVVNMANAIGLAGMKIVGQRKTRKNKGVARGGREGTKANLQRKRQAFARQLGLKRVPAKGVKRNIINRAVRNGKITL